MLKKEVGHIKIESMAFESNVSLNSEKEQNYELAVKYLYTGFVNDELYINEMSTNTQHLIFHKKVQKFEVWNLPSNLRSRKHIR